MGWACRDARGVPTQGCPPHAWGSVTQSPLGHLHFSGVFLLQVCWKRRLSLLGREDLPQ